jgi:hypothetical protein
MTPLAGKLKGEQEATKRFVRLPPEPGLNLALT